MKNSSRRHAECHVQSIRRPKKTKKFDFNSTNSGAGKGGNRSGGGWGGNRFNGRRLEGGDTGGGRKGWRCTDLAPHFVNNCLSDFARGISDEVREVLAAYGMIGHDIERPPPTKESTCYITGSLFAACIAKIEMFDDDQTFYDFLKNAETATPEDWKGYYDSYRANHNVPETDFYTGFSDSRANRNTE